MGGARVMWDTSPKARAPGQGTQAGPSGPVGVFSGVRPALGPRFQSSLTQLPCLPPALGPDSL